jgi:hypothetical protein
MPQRQTDPNPDQGQILGQSPQQARNIDIARLDKQDWKQGKPNITTSPQDARS